MQLPPFLRTLVNRTATKVVSATSDGAPPAPARSAAEAPPPDASTTAALGGAKQRFAATEGGTAATGGQGVLGARLATSKTDAALANLRHSMKAIGWQYFERGSFGSFGAQLTTAQAVLDAAAKGAIKVSYVHLDGDGYAVRNLDGLDAVMKFAAHEGRRPAHADQIEIV